MYQSKITNVKTPQLIYYKQKFTIFLHPWYREVLYLWYGGNFDTESETYFDHCYMLTKVAY